MIVVVALIFYVACMAALWRLWEGDIVRLAVTATCSLLIGVIAYFIA